MSVVIEELTLTMEPSAVEDYLRRDAEVWTTFLSKQRGFLGKEVWLPSGRAGTIVLVIRWATRSDWKLITPEQVAEVDEGMGGIRPDSLECREYEVLGPADVDR